MGLDDELAVLTTYSSKLPEEATLGDLAIWDGNEWKIIKAGALLQPDVRNTGVIIRKSLADSALRNK